MMGQKRSDSEKKKKRQGKLNSTGNRLRRAGPGRGGMQRAPMGKSICALGKYLRVWWGTGWGLNAVTASKKLSRPSSSVFVLNQVTVSLTAEDAHQWRRSCLNSCTCLYWSWAVSAVLYTRYTAPLGCVCAETEAFGDLLSWGCCTRQHSPCLTCLTCLSQLPAWEPPMGATGSHLPLLTNGRARHIPERVLLGALSPPLLG